MGYGVYPRFFDEGKGKYDRPCDPKFGIQDYSRLVFRIIGKPNWSGYIETNRKDIKFSNGALVYVLAQDISNTGTECVLVSGEETELIISRTILDSK